MPSALAKTPPLTPAEQRRSRRPRVLLGGKLVYGPLWLTADCAIRDLTGDGARLRLAGPAVISDPVVLIEVGTGMAHTCEITWRRLPDLGVSFVLSDDLSSPGRPELARLRRIWLDSQAR